MAIANLRPIAFVVAATNHGSMLVNRHDYRLTERGGYGVGFQLLNNSAFDPAEVDFALQLLSTRKEFFGPGVVAIDCGANIGVHTIEWAKHMHAWGEVISVEAQERIFYALAGNIAMNNCFNARAMWAAVGASSGTIQVPSANHFTPSSFGSLEIRKTERTEFIGQTIDYSLQKTIETRLFAIDDLALPRIDFIKIDIEGMEMEALQGAADSISRCKPQMMIEKIKSNENHITEFLKAQGYVIFGLGINILAIHESDPTSKQVKVNAAAG
jgi:FkbM family methyltransferase